MATLLQNIVANAVLGTVLAILAAAITRVVRRAPLAHFVWLLVLLKLITPPLLRIEIPLPTMTSLIAASAATPNSASQAADVRTIGQEVVKQDRPIDVASIRTDREENRDLPDTPTLSPLLGLDPVLSAQAPQSIADSDTLENGADCPAPQVSSPALRRPR